ncbi:hypothetical protein AVEN_122736-1 [Araneus ventricosus]|uniref:Tyrosine-protein phosphatase domain-containing protein n=1 Tax=Araneus ventricosus TaxID=182803 RepID=A0A4Y2W7F0_ARAVE|nr:hypothetical protein AVEN_122736-1 [Araneus ventricosus]
MCVQYWPTDLDKPEEYGNLEITLLAEEQLANFFIRTVKIRKVMFHCFYMDSDLKKDSVATRQPRQRMVLQKIFLKVPFKRLIQNSCNQCQM